MSDQKTLPTGGDVQAFLDAVEDKRKADSYELLEMMQEITGEPPVVWGHSMIGFGQFHYKYASGHEGDTFVVGFAPRKRNFSIYLNCAFDGAEDLLDRLGKHKTGVACLYVNKLDDVDRDVLRELIERAAENVRATSGEAG